MLRVQRERRGCVGVGVWVTFRPTLNCGLGAPHCTGSLGKAVVESVPSCCTQAHPWAQHQEMLVGLALAKAAVPCAGWCAFGVFVEADQWHLLHHQALTLAVFCSTACAG